MFISGDTFYNSTFFYEQLEFTWLSVFVAIKLRGEIDAKLNETIAGDLNDIGIIVMGLIARVRRQNGSHAS